MNAQPDLDRLVSDWLRSEAPVRAPDRVLATTLDRVAVLGQERTLTQWRVSDRSGTSRMSLIAATAALLVLLAAAVFIGGQSRDDVRPAPIPPPAAPVVPPGPPVPPPATVDSGTARTELGTIRWIALEGDSRNIPASEIFETPGGFAAIEPDLDGEASRFWRSTDGLAWALAPLPVPASGAVKHAVAAGEHWIWSETDIRLWRSGDFASWAEVDLDGLRPPRVDGVRWKVSSVGPATIGSRTVFPWQVTGALELEDLLGIEAEDGHALIVGFGREEPPLGAPREVWRVPQTVIGYDSQNKEVVGSIRVTLDEGVVRVTDAERGVVVTDIDPALVGADPAVLADELHRFGFIRGRAGGAVIIDGVARGLVPPPHLTHLSKIGERFVAQGEDYVGDGPRLVWTSADGEEWESLGPPVFPASPEVFQVDRRFDADLDRPLSANVLLVDDSGGQISEVWTSLDGLRWDRAGVVSTYPEPALMPIPAFGGFLATGDEFKVHVSATGATWGEVQGLLGPRRVFQEDGGTSTSSVTRDAVFLVDLPLSGDRLLWILRRQDAP